MVPFGGPFCVLETNREIQPQSALLPTHRVLHRKHRTIPRYQGGFYGKQPTPPGHQVIQTSTNSSADPERGHFSEHNNALLGSIFRNEMPTKNFVDLLDCCIGRAIHQQFP